MEGRDVAGRVRRRIGAAIVERVLGPPTPARPRLAGEGWFAARRPVRQVHADASIPLLHPPLPVIARAPYAVLAAAAVSLLPGWASPSLNDRAVAAGPGDTGAVPYDPAICLGSAAHDRYGRPAYSPGLEAFLTQETGLDGNGRLLDVGCGSGVLAVRLAHPFGQAVGLDPDADMLAEGCPAAGESRVPGPPAPDPSMAPWLLPAHLRQAGVAAGLPRLVLRCVLSPIVMTCCASASRSAPCDGFAR